MKNTLLYCVLAFFLVLFESGCQTDTGAYVPQNTNINDKENHAGFVLLDSVMKNAVTCTGIEQRLMSDGRTAVTANIRNRKNRPIHIQVNCVFKDAQGFETEGPGTPFQDLTLSENAQESVQFISLNDKAKLYTIRVRAVR